MRVPAEVRKALLGYLAQWQRQETHGLIRRLIWPHPLYRCVPADGAGKGKAAQFEFKQIGWRVFFRSRAGEVAALDAVVRADGEYGFRMYVGEAAWLWLERVRKLGRRRAVTKGHSAAVLTIPSIHISMLWFRSRGGKRDLFARLDRVENGDRWSSRAEVEESVARELAASADVWAKARSQRAPG